MYDALPTNSIDDAHPELLWQLTGARSGPTLLITGNLDDLAPAVTRLQMLPSLVYLRGTLLVGGPKIEADADEVLSLKGLHPNDMYWGILGRAAELGMISGRGIPMGRDAA